MITRAVGEVRPLLAERGCTVEGGVRLHTGADVVAHLGASGQVDLPDATEVRVRRPAAGRAGRQRFIAGKARANTVKALVLTVPGTRKVPPAEGRLLLCGQTRPGTIHDLTPGRPGRASGPHSGRHAARRRRQPGPPARRPPVQ